MKNLLVTILSFVVAAFGFITTNAQAITVTVSDNVTENTTWTSSEVYGLNGFVFVEPGVTLTIEPGTVIKGIQEPTNDDFASALIVARGATIIADGTAADPIVFTAETDNSAAGDVNLDQFATGLWGGLIVLGNGVLNTPESGRNSEGFIEEAVEGIPEGEPLAIFGGTDNEDNSGIIRYVSIRHGGAELAPNDEINGLTLGAVGSGTIVDFVEVYANDDDGIEWFGGACNVKHAVVAFVSDDSFDYDQGSNFNGQFWLTVGANEAGSNRSGEHDGATDPESAQPFTAPNISNVTYIGKGAAPQGEPEIILFRDAAGGRYFNSVFCESNSGLQVELNFGQPITSNTQLNVGNLQVRNNDFGGGTLFVPSIAFNITPSGCDPGDPCNNQLNTARNVAASVFSASNNTLSQTCPIVSVSRAEDGGLDPLYTGSGATDFSGNFSGAFFDQVDYRGAFGPDAADFWAGWTYLAQRGVFANN